MRPVVWGPFVFAAASAVFACGSGDTPPSKGNYTVEFPSTEAAVATDFVQILVFDVDPAKRAEICDELVASRITDPDNVKPIQPPAEANICEMRAGRKPVVIPYGEHAIVAVAQRMDGDQRKDFLIGCAIMTIGEGDAPLPIPLRPVAVDATIPSTKCPSVGEYCDGKC